jgi:hypothetical protein
MAWQPGQPIQTAADEAEWQARRRARKLEQQRERRKANSRIDYYPSKEARAVIESLWQPCAGGDYSSVIDSLVLGTADLPE